ncbi:MAG: cytochrome c, partial [Chthonomonadales bacterium]
GAKGEGRYEHNTYYRPAIWGEHSFNNRAGLGAKPDKMAAFLKANMPFGSGGALTVQEAWDLTTFIDKQWRPERPHPQ